MIHQMMRERAFQSRESITTPVWLQIQPTAEIDQAETAPQDLKNFVTSANAFSRLERNALQKLTLKINVPTEFRIILLIAFKTEKLSKQASLDGSARVQLFENGITGCDSRASLTCINQAALQ